MEPNKANDIVLVEGLRTPYSRFGGALRKVPSVVLGSHVMRRVIERAGIEVALIDEVYYGVTLPAEVALDGPTSGRQALLRAGFPERTLSLTIDRGCCSSITAVHLATRSIAAREATWVVAAGAENMGRAAFLSPPDLRWGHRRGPLKLKDPLYELGADIGGKPVAVDVGEVALEWGVTRQQQDEWAVGSHRKYFEAKAAGFYDDHVEAVVFKDYEAELDHDEFPRADANLESLAQLQTVYGSPTVTAGNAPGLDTGATALLLTTRAAARDHGLEPLGTIVGIASIACAPRDIAVAPGPAIEKLAKSLNWDPATLDVIEVNEAFAAVPPVSARYLADGDKNRERAILDRMNPCGGAVAIGHPTGASGARLVLQLIKQLRARGGGVGISAICGALGQADAVAVVVH
ncbi:MAG: thiolase family protein [Acidobacteria bacterium]|nr:thiolase family protein [Acidobacteriota bacterium]